MILEPVFTNENGGKLFCGEIQKVQKYNVFQNTTYFRIRSISNAVLNTGSYVRIQPSASGSSGTLSGLPDRIFTGAVKSHMLSLKPQR